MSSPAIQLLRFVAESNRIEGIQREPTQGELDAHAAFLSLQTVTVADMESFVDHIAGVPLRRKPGQNVRIGKHVPPPGGQRIEAELRSILAVVNAGTWTPFDAHQEYERLHPFMDGNGRSGRALWMWHMKQAALNPFALPFLHRWYYQSLDASRAGA